MKQLILVAFLVVVVVRGSAQEQGFGLGIVIGDPTGLAAKSWTGSDRALAFALAWGGIGNDNGYFHVQGDYLFHHFNLITVAKGKLPVYYGPGARLRVADNSSTRFGIRFPVGLNYLFEGAPVDVFLEVAPTLDLIPGTSFDLDAGIGFRYWFGK